MSAARTLPLARGVEPDPATTSDGRSNGAGPPAWATRRWDLLVVGGGNAAVVAALSANDLGARVLIVERAPRALRRGGNSRHTPRKHPLLAYESRDDYNSGTYPFEELVERPLRRR